APSDPSYSPQWALQTIHPLDGWSIFPGSFNASAGATIAIVDSGIDSSHPDFAAGHILTGAGANCLTGTCVSDPADDDFGHGTHVAGIAAASTDNGVGISGLAFSSPLVPVKVLDSTGSGSAAALA